MKIKNPNVFLVGSVILILMGIALVSVVKRISPKTSEDVRARASSQNVLKLDGTVTAGDPQRGLLMVSNVQFNAKHLSGDGQDLGAWEVTVPAEFDMTSVGSGSRVTIGVDATTFKVTTHEVTALSIQVVN